VRGAGTPVLTFLIYSAAREKLRVYLGNSGSLGVQTIMGLREVSVTGRFVPATRPGGQGRDGISSGMIA
jgi:hypothetical protein